MPSRRTKQALPFRISLELDGEHVRTKEFSKASVIEPTLPTKLEVIGVEGHILEGHAWLQIA